MSNDARTRLSILIFTVVLPSMPNSRCIGSRTLPPSTTSTLSPLFDRHGPSTLLPSTPWVRDLGNYGTIINKHEELAKISMTSSTSECRRYAQVPNQEVPS
ncbi:hypothetical protein GBA52_003487 [Prunus armeniaca]|nr:hypothetical protein GBA52_003487 [Prunus armeniaca]